MDKNIFVTKESMKEYNTILARLKKYDNDYEYKDIRVSYGIILITKNDDELSFFLLQRPCTNEYQEFVTGAYKNKSLYNIFSLMTKEERDRIRKNNFTTLYSDIYGTFQKKDTKRKRSLRRYLEIESEIDNLLDITESQRRFIPWFFPKGKAKDGETCIQTAIREFREESNFFPHDIEFLDGKLEDEYIGTNDKHYKNIYYVAVTNVKQVPRKRKLSRMGWKPPQISYEARDATWIIIKTEEDINNLTIVNERLKKLMTNVYNSTQCI